jgi:hypothetical protein
MHLLIGGNISQTMMIMGLLRTLCTCASGQKLWINTEGMSVLVQTVLAINVRQLGRVLTRNVSDLGIYRHLTEGKRLLSPGMQLV